MLGKTVIVLMILLLLEPLFLSCTNDEDDDDDDDSAAMAKLAAAFDTKPPGWSADSSSSACTWRGVGCTGTGSIHIVSIMLESKSLSGTLPSPFPSLPNLYYLDLSDNNLSGEIPSLASLKSLEFLYLRNNCFTSMAYGFFLEPPVKLVVLDLSDNSFLVPWTIPKELSRLESLKIFRSLNSNVIGNLPDVFHFRFLETFSLSHNSLNGSLPPSLGGSSIANLELDHQKMKLSGNIQVLSTMSKLYRVDLEGNQFTGPIPDLSKCKDLRTLLLGNNQLTGLVPDSLGSLSLDTISLSGNKLQGPLPAFLLDNFLLNATLDGNNFCTNYRSPCDPQVDTLLEIAGAFDYPLRLSDAWKGNDACQNWAHVKCNPRREVVIIDMGKQYFCGTMSPAFSSLRSLQYLYLNDNNLTGFIPKSLVDLPHLEVLDISNNNLTGEIPRFRSSVKLITAGNPLLRKPASAKGEKNKKVAITLVAFLVTITGAFCIFLTARRTTKQKGSENTITQSKSEAYSRAFSVLLKKESQIKLQDIQIISFEDLVNATDNFHPANNLGQGGFGPVFKGKLRNGQEIAVKRLSNASGQGLEEFMNEVVVISKLQHKHLVQLVGCCITWEEKLLVYEYMPNKSLDAFLFDPNKRKVLDWEKRYNIIIGISHGLLYLHTDSRLRIIHRDIKASNILLDEEFNPKISDFGMARIFDASEEHAKTRRVVGTYGYMPPEYAMEGRFSEKSDVFSFGILLLEIISGRRNTSSNDENGLSLLEYAWNLWNGDSILGLIDPIVLNHNTDQVLRCIHIGLLCVQDLVKDRPKISKVISMLGSEVRLPTPKEPMFLARQVTEDHSEPNFNHTKSYIKENDIRHDASLIILEDK